MIRTSLFALALAAAISAYPLVFPPAGDREFAGTDGLAVDAIADIRPDYRRWPEEPLGFVPSPRVESLLFAAEATLGAGFLGFYLWLRRRQARRQAMAVAADARGPGDGSH